MKALLTVFALITTGATFAQNDSIPLKEKTVQSKSYFSIGSTALRYQDVKTSNLQYRGGGVNVLVGTNRLKSKYYWAVDLRFNYSNIKTSRHQGKGSMTNALVSFEYLRKLNSQFHLGGKWNIFEVNLRSFPNTGNNSSSLLYNSTFLINGKYSYKVNEKVNLSFQAGLGLFGLVKESTSFSNYPTSQYILEDGTFDFQDKKTSNPTSLSYLKLAPIGQYNRIETTISVSYKKRWELVYNWDLINYRTIKSYPLTIAKHSLSIRYNFMNKLKTKKPKK